MPIRGYHVASKSGLAIVTDVFKGGAVRSTCYVAEQADPTQRETDRGRPSRSIASSNSGSNSQPAPGCDITDGGPNACDAAST